MSREKGQGKSRKFRHLVIVFLAIVLLSPPLILKIFSNRTTSRAAEIADGSLVFYAVDAMFGKTTEDVKNGLIDHAGLSNAKVSLHLNDEILFLEPVNSGEYKLTTNVSGAVTEAISDMNGRVLIHGLNKDETKYVLWVTQNDAPEGFYHPTTVRYVVPEKIITGEKTAWYSIFQYQARELILRAQLDDGSPLNGVNLGLHYTDEKKYAEFIQITDGIYRQAQEGETNTTTLLVTANVEGEDGVVLVHGMGHIRSVYASARQMTSGYYLGTQFPDVWRLPRAYDSEIRRIDCGTAIYHVDTYKSSSIPLPAPLVGYGNWVINQEASDEFEGTALNLTKWRTKYVHETPENAYLDGNGYLYNTITPDDVEKKVNIAGVWSYQNDMQYGYFECRFKGAYIPSRVNFWLLSQDEYHGFNEIDVCENFSASKEFPSGGADRLTNMSAHYPILIPEIGSYCPRTTSGRSALLPDNKSTSEDFITYAVLWEPGKVTYYIDGQVVYLLERDYTAPMGVIMDIYSSVNYNELSAINLQELHQGFPVNAMVVDYIRCWTRTDINYAPQVILTEPDDGVITLSLSQSPAIEVDEKLELNTVLSDEFNDNQISASLWNPYYTLESEAYETLRLPKSVSDDYNVKYPVGLTNIAAADDFIAKNYRNDGISHGAVTTNDSLNNPYGYGYYEFRAKAADNTAFSRIALTTRNKNGTDTGQIRVSLRTAAAANTDQGYYAELSAYDSLNNKRGSYREQTLQSAAEDYHIYGILRLKDKTVFYINGEKVFQTDTSPEGNLSISLSVVDDANQNGSDTYARLTDGRDNNFYIDFFRYYTDSTVDHESGLSDESGGSSGSNSNTGTNPGSETDSDTDHLNVNSGSNSGSPDSDKKENNNTDNANEYNATDTMLPNKPPLILNESAKPSETLEVKITESFPENTNDLTYQWYINDIPVQGAIINSFVVPITVQQGDVITAKVSGNGTSKVISTTVSSIHPITAFTVRLYDGVFKRKPDTDGLKFWVEDFTQKRVTAADAVFFFFTSPEMNNLNLNDGEYVERLYTILMGRIYDETGKVFWLSYIEKGVSRIGILRQFLGSQEFQNICENSGIQLGNIPVANEPRDENLYLTAFLYRQYQMVMLRKIDINGLNYWAGKFLHENWTLEEISKSLFFSQEILSKEWPDEIFIDILYKAFLDRTADQEGKAFWLNTLRRGSSRDAVLNFFVYSEEFSKFTNEISVY